MGRAMVAGGCPGMTVPAGGSAGSSIQAGNIQPGAVVYLHEAEELVEYLVVNQRIPSNSSIYDSSCDGTWLLRKDICGLIEWDAGRGDDGYKTSTINAWLNGDFLNSLGDIEQTVIKQVQIPYYSMSLGHPIFKLTCKVFLLAGYELGWTANNSNRFPVIGAKLDYFESGRDTSALAKRIAYLDGAATKWWFRDTDTGATSQAWYGGTNGEGDFAATAVMYGARPALILPQTALFDADTLIFKGAA